MSAENISVHHEYLNGEHQRTRALSDTIARTAFAANQTHVSGGTVVDFVPLGTGFDNFYFPRADYSSDEYKDDWQDQALCAQTDPEVFFPERGSSNREAKKICSKCEVKDECLEAALKEDEHFGIRGGLSEPERRRLKRVVGDRKPTRGDMERVIVNFKQTPGERMLQLFDFLSSEGDDPARFLESIQYNEKIYDTFVGVVLTDMFGKDAPQSSAQVLGKYFTSTAEFDGSQVVGQKSSREVLSNLRGFVEWIDVMHERQDEAVPDDDTSKLTLLAQCIEHAEAQFVENAG